MFNLHMVANKDNHFVVMVLKDGEVVGRVLQTLSKVTPLFLRYDGNFAFCEVTSKRLNRGVQLGAEVPCVHNVHKYYGCQMYIYR